VSNISNLSGRLRDAGHKLTPARQAIIQVLENEDRHLNRVEVLELGQAIYPRLSRATVYRMLELLVALEFIRPIYLSDGCQRFTTAEGGHHHLVCLHCKTVIEFDHCIIEELEGELSDRYRFRVFSHLLEFRGLCENCRMQSTLSISGED